jgi:hypothetical protein
MPYGCLEKRRENDRRYYNNNKDKMRAATIKWSNSHPEKLMFIKARSNARGGGKGKKWEFNLDPSDIVIPKLCPVFGMPLVTDLGSHRYLDNKASLDRIDPNKGYIKGNVWVISWKANRLKSANTIETLEALLMALKYPTLNPRAPQ